MNLRHHLTCRFAAGKKLNSNFSDIVKMESSHAYCPYEKPYAVNGGQTCCDRRLGGLPLESFEVHCDAAMSDEKEGSGELLAQRKSQGNL